MINELVLYAKKLGYEKKFLKRTTIEKVQSNYIKQVVILSTIMTVNVLIL